MRTLLLLLPALILSAQTAPAPKAATGKMAAAPKAPASAPANLNYKESGSPTAPIVVEAFTDYECPHCARFYKEFMPQFTADYIATGKVRFIHRDFPLSQHPHAVQAARYADAAGELGFYDLVVKQIFGTQDIWSINTPSGTGNVDAEVAKVLPPGAMQKVRELVKADPKIDAGMKVDMDLANSDRIPSTPTVVIVSKGKRELVSTVMDMPYSIFRKYLDQKLAAQ
jgi:protein-disulfide isomerase